ncbi:MAG TPA: BrnT family toxin [Rhizobiaceae bacterium]|nr:BrnT family toxin [Rhizobiaceae bacterium]
MKAPREFSFDPAKDASNIASRGISFTLTREFEFETAIVAIDDRRDYGEIRQIAAGFVGERLHILVFTLRKQVCHVISLRKANKREVKSYVAKTTELE